MSVTDSSERQPAKLPGETARTRSKVGAGKTTKNAATEKSPVVTGRPKRKSVAQTNPVKAATSSNVIPETGGIDPYQSGRRVWPD